jgi:hypothetical protein
MTRAEAPAAIRAAGRPRPGCCRFCGDPLNRTFVDLGMSPLCESYVSVEQLDRMEPFYPLRVRVCERCWLVQLPEYVSGQEIFHDYAYFSSYSESWLDHARRYTAQAVERFGLGSRHLVIEVASNDGYLLQYFVQRGVPCLGIEPAANIAPHAERKGVPTLVAFFGERLARRLVAEGRRPDLLIGNNVLAQVHDINDFVAGLAALLAPTGVITIEFPHLVRMVEQNQFDTIYHEHFSYFSFVTAERIFAAHGLTLFDVENIPTHGGSLRIYARHARNDVHAVTAAVPALRERERELGVEHPRYYEAFADRVEETKRKLLAFLIEAKRAGARVAGYGAPGKGNTLLNYCGIRTDLLEYTVDRNPRKQGKFLPGTHVPIHPPERVFETKPDYLLILPWNLKDEIVVQMAGIREWGGRFVVPIPELAVFP